MAAPFGMVNVGNTVWLFVKSTPSFLIIRRVGASVALTDPGRRPSAIKRITFRRDGQTRCHFEPWVCFECGAQHDIPLPVGGSHSSPNDFRYWRRSRAVTGTCVSA